MSLTCRALLAFFVISTAGCCCGSYCNYPCGGCYQPCCGPVYPMGCSTCGGQIGPYPSCGMSYGQQFYRPIYAGSSLSNAAPQSVAAVSLNGGPAIQLVSAQRPTRNQPAPETGQPTTPTAQTQPNQSIDLSEFERQQFEILQGQLNAQQLEINQLCGRLRAIDNRTAWLP
jgi:hypothetical protein